MPNTEENMNSTLVAVQRESAALTEPSPKSSQDWPRRRPAVFEATLTLDEVTKERSGNYTCSPSNARSASVRLHIIDGNFEF